MRRVAPGLHWPLPHVPLATVTLSTFSDAFTLVTPEPAGSVTLAATLVHPMACALEYTSVGDRQRFMVRTDGNGCTIRRSPHSDADADASAIVRHCPRARTAPGLAEATSTPGAGGGGAASPAVTFRLPSSRTVVPTFAWSTTRPVVVGAPDVKDTCTVPVAPAFSGRLAGLGAHPLTPAPEHTAAGAYVVGAVPVLVIWKSDDESVFGGTL